MDHFTYDHVREPGAHTKDTASQEKEVVSDKDNVENATGEAGAPTKEAAALEEVRGDKDTIEGSTEELKYRSFKPVRHRKKFNLVRRKQVLVFR